MKKVWVAFPRRGESRDEQGEWRWHVMDVLEVANVECHAVEMELVGVFQALKYLEKVVYHYYVDGSEEMTSEQGEEIQQETKMREAGVGTSE